MRLEYSLLAQKNLVNILLYIKKEFGMNVASDIRQQIRLRLRLLKVFPDSGVIHSNEGETIRKIFVKNSTIFYCVIDDIIYILLICDSRMSPLRINSLIQDELNNRTNINKKQ